MRPDYRERRTLEGLEQCREADQITWKEGGLTRRGIAVPNMPTRKIGNLSRKRHWRSEKGVSLIEIIVSLALLGIAATGLTAGLATGLRINLVIESQTVSASAVTAQLEDTLFQTYVEPADYPAVSVPEGFSLAFDNFVIVPTLLERITVAVSDSVKELFRITTYNVNTEFSASPPNLLLVQRDYRWFDNTDALPPVTAFADENTPFTVITTGQVFRLRMSVEASDVPLDAGTQSFKLQFAKDSSGPWSDVGNVASTTPAWRGFDNSSLADGQTSTSVLLGKSIAFQSYEEENPSVPNPSLIPTGVEQWTEWDWVVQENGAAFNTNYLFRMVRADGSPLESYTRFPVLVMPAPVTFTQSDYRWFENADALAPGPALAAELTPFSTTTHGLTYRLGAPRSYPPQTFLKATRNRTHRWLTPSP